MPLSFDTFTLGFGGGLENKSDPKRLDPGKLLRAENVEFVKGNALRTRAGAFAVETIPVTGPTLSGVSLSNPTGPNGNPRGLAAFADGFCLLTDQACYPYAASNNSLQYASYYNPITYNLTDLVSGNIADFRGEVASAQGVIVHAAQREDDLVVVSLVDEETGSLLGQTSATGKKPKVFRIGGIVMVTYIDNSDNLWAWRIVPTDVTGSLAAASFQLLLDLRTDVPYAVAEATSDFALIVWDSDDTIVTGMRLAKINSDGTVGTTATFTGSTDLPFGVAISYDATSGDGVVAWTDAGTDRAKYVIFTASTLAETSNASLTIEGADVQHIAVSFIRYYITGVLTRFVSTVYSVTAASSDLHFTRFYHNTTLITTRRHSMVVSGAYSDGTQSYILLYHESRTGLQDTYFLFDAFARVIGHVHPGAGASTSATALFDYLPEFRAVDGGLFQIAVIAKRQVDAQTDDIVVFEHPYSSRVVFDPTALTISDRFGKSTYMSGSYLWVFDGRLPQEAGLLMFPDMLAADVVETGAGTGFATAGQVYSYKVYYCKRLITGEVYRSKALTVTVAPIVGANVKLQLTIPTLSFARDGANIYIEVYRSVADAAQPALHYLVTNPDGNSTFGDNRFTQNDISTDTVTFVDNYSNTVILDKAIDYQSQGEVPQDVPPGPSYVKQVGNRLYCLGGGIPDNQVWFSKPYVPSRPAEFSGFLVVDDVPDAGGAVTALSDLGGIPVVFKERSIFALAGTPPDALNANGFLETQRLLGEVGCTAPGTVVPTLYGIKFRSHKGFYLLGLDRSLQYTGRDVEGSNAEEFVSGALIPETNTMVFMGPSTKALVFDYEHGQWGNWSNREGLSVLPYGNNRVAFLLTSGEILLRDQTVYHDNGLAYETIVRTAPIKPFDSATKFWHLAMYQFLGAYLGMHSLRCKLYYNREPAPFQTFTFDPTTVINLEGWGSGNWGDGTWGGTPNPKNPVEYQFEKRPRRVRCQTISFEFECLPVDGDPAAMEFSEMTFKAAPIPGMSQLSAVRKL